MPGDIGPGPLMCIKSDTCPSCGDSIAEGVLYQCTGLHEMTFFERVISGSCDCGKEHLWVLLLNKHHMYCPGLFAPLGDPDAEIRETDEPKVVAPVLPKVKETENV